MKYFHRTTLSPDAALDAAKAFFGSRMAPAEESPRRRAVPAAHATDAQLQRRHTHLLELLRAADPGPAARGTTNDTTPWWTPGHPKGLPPALRALGRRPGVSHANLILPPPSAKFHAH